MNQNFPQSAPMPAPGVESASMNMMMGVVILALMAVTGMVLGFRALRDIRLANGTLGGAGLATFAAGLLPALAIIVACGAGMTFFADAALPRPRPHLETWTVVGAIVGLWLSFLMLRGMHREATGWVRPALLTATRSRLCTAAIVLTIAGAAAFLLTLLGGDRGARPAGLHLPPSFAETIRRRGEINYWPVLALVSMVTLLAGLICGVLARQETAGKVCAWISGALFIALALLTVA